MMASGGTVALMTFLGLPVSSTQAVVGAIVGASLLTGGVSFGPLVKIGLSWILTPLGGMLAAYIDRTGAPYHPLYRRPDVYATTMSEAVEQIITMDC